MNKELRAKTNEELVDLVVRLKGQLLQYRFKKAHGELEKAHVIKDTKRVIAKIFTILTERGAKYDVSAKTQSAMAAGNKEAAGAAADSWKQLKQQRAQKKAAGSKRRTDAKAAAQAAPKPASPKQAKAAKPARAKSAQAKAAPLTGAKSKQMLNKMKKAKTMPRKRGV